MSTQPIIFAQVSPITSPVNPLQAPTEESNDPASSRSSSSSDSASQSSLLSDHVIGFHATPIGFHATPERIFIFYALPHGTDCESLRSTHNLFPVVLPKICYPIASTFSVDRKLLYLLKNLHFKVDFSENSISFTPIPPEQKTWEIFRKREVPATTTIFYHADGRISFSQFNTVSTWNYQSDTITASSFGFSKITAIAETFSGELIVGNKPGELWMQGKRVYKKKEDKSAAAAEEEIGRSITKISPINSSLYIIQFDDSQKIVFDIEKRAILPASDFTVPECYTILRSGLLVALDTAKKSLIIWEMYSQGEWILRKYSLGKEHEFEIIKKISDTSVVLGAPGTFMTVDTSSGESKKYTNVTSLFQLSFLTPIDSQKFVFASITQDFHTFLSIHDISTKEKTSDNKPRKIATITQLSDGSIMYATYPSGAELCVMNREGTGVFSSTQLVPNNHPVSSLKALPNGFVAIHWYQSLVVIKPQIKQVGEQEEEGNDQTEIPYNPAQLERYNNHAETYKEERDKQYQTFLARLVAAIRVNNLYYAQLFYEKARKIKPDNKQPCQFFLFYLQNTPHHKQRRQVLLDLERLDHNTEEESLASKGCKKRLLVGEGTFTFTEALIEKHKHTHPSLSQALIATELLSPTDLIEEEEGAEPLKNVIARINRLVEKGVTVLFGIDARQVHQSFKGQRIPRIHWTCPFGESSDSAREAFKKVIPNFFQSCAAIQIAGDRIYVVLMQHEGDVRIYRQKENPIILGATQASYRLIRKRAFGSERYPGYKHAKTGTTAAYSKGGVEREFVFEKAEATTVGATATLENAEALRDPTQKHYEIKKSNSSTASAAAAEGAGSSSSSNSNSAAALDNSAAALDEYYFECSTDEDSSDYYESDEDYNVASS